MEADRLDDRLAVLVLVRVLRAGDRIGKKISRNREGERVALGLGRMRMVGGRTAPCRSMLRPRARGYKFSSHPHSNLLSKNTQSLTFNRVTSSRFCRSLPPVFLLTKELLVFNIRSVSSSFGPTPAITRRLCKGGKPETMETRDRPSSSLSSFECLASLCCDGARAHDREVLFRGEQDRRKEL